MVDVAEGELPTTGAPCRLMPKRGRELAAGIDGRSPVIKPYVMQQKEKAPIKNISPSEVNGPQRSEERERRRRLRQPHLQLEQYLTRHSSRSTVNAVV